MFTPPGDMPPLVDPNPPFIPAPQGASNGGQPGFFDAFPGARGGGGGGGGFYSAGTSPWAAPQSTPYPTFTQPLSGSMSPWASGPSNPYPNPYANANPYPNANAPPLSAPALGGTGGGWAYGAYTPAGQPVWGPPQGGAPASPWGASPASASASANPWGPSSASAGPSGGGMAWGAPGAGTSAAGGGGGGGGGFTSAFPGWGAEGGHTPYTAPGTPFESAMGQPVAGGWFGTGGGGGGGGGGVWGTSGAGGGGGWGTLGGGGGGWSASGAWGAGDWLGDEYKKSRHKHEKRRSDSMKRSNSQGPPVRKSSLHRSSSWGDVPDWGMAGYAAAWGGGGGGGGGSGSAPAYAQGDLYDQNNLSRRPRDWRPDYVAGKGFASYIPTLGRNRSIVKDYSDTVRRQIHPLMDYETLKPAMYYDMREPRYSPADIEFFRIDRAHNQVDLMQLATIPACPFIRIFHAKLPWYIDVHQGQNNGVTVQDVFIQLHAQLQSPIHGRHFWNDQLSEGDRIEITRAFQERVKSDRGLVGRGILQVDFLGKKAVLEGFVRGPKGLWEMKTGRLDS